MSASLQFRTAALKKLTNEIGCYALADLDNIPLYVGQSTDGIRTRVRRHLTSARSDVIANRQIDVWEIGYVWAYPVSDIANISNLEAHLFHYFNSSSPLMNGSTPRAPASIREPCNPNEVVQVLTDEELDERRSPELRLPRQASHYARLVDHFLVVKSSDEIARSMHAHFERLTKYHIALVGTS